MKFDWRVSAVAAGAAFVLSLLIGIIAGVAFGALLFRAILWAVLFGGGAAGVIAVLDRFLPELRQSLSQPKTQETDAPESGSVDIVVDEDLLGEGSPISVAGDPGGPEDDIEELDAADPDEEGGGVDPDSPLAAATGGEESGDEPETLEEAPPEAASAGSLPDIGGFAGSFEESGASEMPAEPAEGSDEDAASMARAIRTVLKREE